MTETKQIPLQLLLNNEGQIEGVPRNPRQITEEAFDKLKKSLKESDLTDFKPLIVYPYGEQFVVLGGNMRLRALRELGVPDVSCIVVPEGTPVAHLKKIVILDNNEFGEYDWDAIANEWSEEPLQDWGVVLPVWSENVATDEEEIKRKEAEFRERMAAGEISEEDEEYQEFLEKFKLKKTTDDCYTPVQVYEAVANYVEKTYKVSRAKFVRPFYPNGDYQKENYPAGCVVVDNPPFSILAEILQFYKAKKIPFFLFAPTLTLFSSSSSSCALCAGVQITYENGASIPTSFLTSFESDTIRCKSVPELYAAVKAANDENLKELKKQLPKYEYPLEVVTSPKVGIYSRLGIDFVVPKAESLAISSLDAQKEKDGSAIYGKGYLTSTRVRAERERAERERAERERAERERAERERAERERAERWTLSARERAICEQLNPKAI